MCVYLLLLLVTVTVFSHCGATEYYVRPTEPTNTSCPAGQSCLTLNHYTSDSNNYFKSNTVFKFLPGTHRINKPLHIRNVHNVSLTAYDDSSDQTPHIMAEFSCEYGVQYEQYENEWKSVEIHCAAIWFTNVTDAAISGINVTVETQGMSAIVLHNVSGAHIQLNVVCTKEQEFLWYDNITQIGILAYESSYIWIDLSVADNCTNGIIMIQGRYHNISNTIATNSKFCGMILYATNTTRIMNCNLINNWLHGILIYSSTSTSLMNVSVEHNQDDGIWIDSSTSTSLMNVSAEHNQGDGIWIAYSTSTSLMNVSAEHSQRDGIWIVLSTSTSLMNVSVEHNQEYGIWIVSSTSTSLTNVSAQNNQQNGIYIHNCQNVSLHDVISSNNSVGLNHGISLTLINNISITNGILSSIVVDSTVNLQVSFCLFSEVDASTTITSIDPDSLPAIIELYDSSLNISECMQFH